MALEQYLVPYGSSANLCFDCRRACGGCSWSAVDPETGEIRYEPVPGWTAEPTILFDGSYRDRRRKIPTMHITACPLFVPDPPRKSDPAEFSLAQLWVFLRWERGIE